MRGAIDDAVKLFTPDQVEQERTGSTRPYVAGAGADDFKTGAATDHHLKKTDRSGIERSPVDTNSSRHRSMALFHAVVHTDHRSAEILEFDSDQVLTRKIEAHAHATPQHHSEVRTEHEFFGTLCDALGGISEVLVTGTHTATQDFQHYVAKHRPHVLPHIVGYEVVDHPTANQLVALARKFFAHYNQMAGRPSNG